MSSLINLRGKTFSRLTVIARGRNLGGQVSWVCRCSCGKILTIRGGGLRSGNTRSCGCLSIDTATKRLTKHGKYNHKLYTVFDGMKGRCNRKSHHQYKDYGGRGIKICDEWSNDFLSFFNFAMDNGWKKHLQIDRINNDENYEPSNCRFVTSKVNNNNKRVIKITKDGE